MATPVNCVSFRLVGAASFQNGTWTHSAIYSFGCFAAFGVVAPAVAWEKAADTAVHKFSAAAPSAHRTEEVLDASHSPPNLPWGTLGIMEDPLLSAVAYSRP